MSKDASGNQLKDQALIKVHQVAGSADSLPICEEPAVLSVHFTTPVKEVIYNGEISHFDIADNEVDEANLGEVLSKDQIRIAHTTKLSISYDV